MEELPIETTVYSMSADPPPEANRRADERHLTLFRVGSILIDERRELCLVKNISAGGALIRAYCKLDEGQRLEIELKERQPVAGQVGWITGSDAGIVFDRPVDVLDLLASNAGGTKPRMPRVEIQSIAYIREGAVIHRTMVRNISQGGINAQSKTALTPGAEVVVTLPGLPPQAGVVRWQHDDSYGVTFNTVVSLSALVTWLQGQQRG